MDVESAKNRWSVTYTKHIKQKRKVYQDGFLDLHFSTNKVKLFDEFEKLLECRILKNDEVVSSGEMLTLNAYLVDVGEPEGDFSCKPVHNLNFGGRRRKMMSNSISSEKKNAQPKSLSPSQKFIREFKKREIQKYGTPKSSPDTMKSETTEWQVLYTTQITQKAKKYHDGFLCLAACGSMGRQIMLFDETRKLLGSRFLRRDEVIRSGESTTLDGYLVEIEEFKDNHKPLAELNVQRYNCNIAGKSEEMDGEQNCIKSNKFDGKELKKSEVLWHGAPQNSPDIGSSNTTEWQAIYTTHLTQKAKKYHDGFLRLAITRSLQRQVKLYDHSKNLLNCRFLRKDEIIRSGESIAFDAHLVDIGEPQKDHGIQIDVNAWGNKCTIVPKAEKSVVQGKPENNVQLREIADPTGSFSVIDQVKLSKGVPANKPLRDANQILSILQKPRAVKTNDPGSTDNKTTGKLCSPRDLKGSDAVVDTPGDSQKPCKNIDIDLPNEDLSYGNCPDDLWSSTSISNVPGDDGRISSREPNSPSKMDELPSFNFGFE